MLKAAIVGLGKMGLSHQSMVNAHPDLHLSAVCDTSGYMLDVLSKYTGVRGYGDVEKMLAAESLDCIFVATPTRHHPAVVEQALERGLHVFCEKPFATEPDIGYRLADLAERKNLVNQVGYHYRHVGSFNEAKRLIDNKVIGELHHIRAEAYGPVVLRSKGSTWRSKSAEGGGCLFDYACHAIDLMNYLVGRPQAISGTVLNSVFSNDVDDEVYSTFRFSQSLSGQLATNWSDESYRKMSMRIGLWGTNGRLVADRQELQVYVRDLREPDGGISKGWTVRNTTELTKPVWFYVRGEEYSAQLEQFVFCIKNGTRPISTFRSASDTALVAAMMRKDAMDNRFEAASQDLGEGLASRATRPPAAVRGRMRKFFGKL